ncbi:MAG: mechanosensitive ion channel [Gammaproteobacteria bacterium]|nr:mechanosensitive ion channel [Gammaproteobacteria bacterium]
MHKNNTQRFHDFIQPAKSPPIVRSSFWFIVVFLSMVFLQPLMANDESQLDALFNQPPVDKETLLRKIKDSEQSSQLAEEKQNQLLDSYRTTLGYLNDIETNKLKGEQVSEFRKLILTPLIKVREKLNKQQNLEIKPINFGNKQLSNLEQMLYAEQANLAAVTAKLSDISQQLSLAAIRPNIIRQRIIELNEQQEEITATLIQQTVENENLQQMEVLLWMLQTQNLAIRTEISTLDQERLSLPLRVEYLDILRQYYQLVVDEISSNISYIQEKVNILKLVKAGKDKANADKLQMELESKPLIIRDLAEKNTLLTQQLNQFTLEFQQFDRDNENAKKKITDIKIQYENIRKKLKIAGYGPILAKVLIEQQRQIPADKAYSIRDEQRKQRISELGLLQLNDNNERQGLDSISKYVQQLVDKHPDIDTTAIHKDLKKLAMSRKSLLEKSKGLIAMNLRLLQDYAYSDQQLHNTVEEYSDFLNRNQLWIRTAPLPNIERIGAIPHDLSWLLSESLWKELSIALFEQANSTVFFIVTVFLIILVLTKSRWLLLKIQSTGKNVGILSKDTLYSTFYAISLTLLLAASWPLIFTLFGWQLSSASNSTAFTIAVAESIKEASMHWFFLRFFYYMYLPKGVLIAHFKVPEVTANRVATGFKRLQLVYMPTIFVLMILFRYDLASTTGETGRILLIIFLLNLAVFFKFVLFSKDNKISYEKPLVNSKRSIRTQKPLKIFLVVVPLLLAALNLLGYMYTVAQFANLYLFSIWLLLCLWFVKKFLVRWLNLSQCRFKLKEVQEKRLETLARKKIENSSDSLMESESGDMFEPEIDFAELEANSLYLLNVGLIFCAAIGLMGVWANILPAFALFDDITLWTTVVNEAEGQLDVAVTLKDLIKSIIILFMTVIFAKFLPSLLEIIMIQRTSMNAGSRYTVTTITNYIIIAIGFFMFFATLGMDWSKLQWLIAALGVGIGFGLQEIVANFISGIIILFERPFRVGDIVTIGNNNGVVTRIRIRATTIRNWDRKELLVPNKDFITGQLINWTLSEPVTRIVIPVGLAYGGDVEQALKRMLEAAEENPNILTDPPPSVIFDAFGDNALSLILRCFIDDVDSRVTVISALNKAINDKFIQDNLEIAFPQRDIHLNTKTPLEIRIQSSKNFPI